MILFWTYFCCSVIKAFITFESEEGCLRCKRTYPNVGWLSGWFQDRKVRMGKRVVTISNALDPSGGVPSANFNSNFYTILRHKVGEHGSACR